MPEDLLIFPFGGNAREALVSVLRINAVKKRWNVLGFIDDDAALAGRSSSGVKVLGAKAAIRRYPDARILAVPGSPDTYTDRKRAIDSLGVDEERFATIADPSASIASDAKIGRNTVLMQGVVVSCGAMIGDHCVILPNTVISHDARVGDHCCIGSNVSVSGNVKIGPGAYIGSGAKLRERVSVGAGALVGLGSVVVKDVEEDTVVAGSPAKAIRRTQRAGEKR